MEPGHSSQQASDCCAPSAFLASADGVSDLMRQLLPTHLSASSHGDTDLDLSTRKDALPVDTRLVNILNVWLAFLQLYRIVLDDCAIFCSIHLLIFGSTDRTRKQWNCSTDHRTEVVVPV